ncbi:MAG: tRNA-dihydrouridine synthase, partial [Planctomycetota bacterium]
MADVTDVAFRSMFVQCGKPDVFWTEFVAADGLFLRPIIPGIGDQPKNEFERIALAHGVGTDHPLLKDLLHGDGEYPLVAQFFSRDPDRMRRAAALARDLGYDGIDINMGCPADVICKQGAGSAMIKTPELAVEIIAATKEG